MSLRRPTNRLDRAARTLGRALGLASLAGALATGCAAGEDPSAPSPSTTGLALSVGNPSGDSVAGFRFKVDRVACKGEYDVPADSWSATEDLLPFTLPGGIPGFEGAPFDADSSHAFADHFFTLPAGCYDVKATPVDAYGAPVDDCTTARAEGVQVRDGKTTEILLVSQCDGDETGGLDVIAAINHAPTLKSVLFNPSKFACPGAEVEICATAVDPDGDPLEFEWHHLAGGDFASGPTVTRHETYGNATTECVVIVGKKPGAHSLKVKVFDLVHDADYGLVRMEDWLNDHGYKGAKSHDSLVLPLYFSDSDKCDGVQPPPDQDVYPDVKPDVYPDAGPDVYPPDVEYDVEPDVKPPKDGCTRSQGYWKTHPKAWPLPTTTKLCGKTWLSILWDQPDGGDAWVNLAHQYIAAELNVAAGADDSKIRKVLAAAEYLLKDNCYGLSAKERRKALDLKDILDAYNNGKVGPPKCK